ncbi:MAG: hypothetical protein JW787_14705 [Sedimentisphaerales bacterium]|nr:hypothetical protein [Sedimentisphaerales bacterium]
MPLNVRKIAVNLAVICFFILSIVAIVSGLSPFTCCKRAIAGAVLVYVAAGITVRLINMILIDAMITRQMEQLGNSEIAAKRKDKAGR